MTNLHGDSVQLVGWNYSHTWLWLDSTHAVVSDWQGGEGVVHVLDMAATVGPHWQLQQDVKVLSW